MAVAENVPHSNRFTGLDYLTNMQAHGHKMGLTRIFSKRFDSNRTLFSKKLCHRDISHFTTIEFSKCGDLLACGSIDKNGKTDLVLWSMSKEFSDLDQHTVINCKDNFDEPNSLAFNISQSKLIASSKNGKRPIVLYDTNTKRLLQEFEDTKYVNGLSWNPVNDYIFASCSARCSLWDLRQRQSQRLTLANNIGRFISIMHHPIKSELLAAANIYHGVYLLDIRNPRTYLNKFESSGSTSYASFDSIGRHLLAVRNQRSAALYDTDVLREIAELDYPEYHKSFYNKSGCFAGDDQFVLSGSSNYKIYAWKIPTKKESGSLYINYPHFVLDEHHSIINEVKYNNTYGVIAACGTEKFITLWSAFHLPSYKEQINQFVEEDSEDYIQNIFEETKREICTLSSNFYRQQQDTKDRYSVRRCYTNFLRKDRRLENGKLFYLSSDELSRLTFRKRLEFKLLLTEELEKKLYEKIENKINTIS